MYQIRYGAIFIFKFSKHYWNVQYTTQITHYYNTTVTVRFPHFPFEFFIVILPNSYEYTHTHKLKVRELQQPRKDEHRSYHCVYLIHMHSICGTGAAQLPIFFVVYCANMQDDMYRSANRKSIGEEEEE